MSDNDERERFGRYLILDHLVDGGMAKICRARFLGEQADRVVAIKMVQPQFSKDESFKVMFMDEIKVTFGLLHPNIVQTYDYGMHADQLYVAMEYCDGRNLKEYLDKLKQKKFVFPVEISVYIITQACQGLHYAHTYVDKLTGKPANIVHRDISPHNIMLTYDGAVKVIDFGIAKAESNSEATQAGTIKGKLSYLAPEYLEGLDLDHCYDQFAIGITLWEMLTSRKLFKAANDLAVLKKIQECKVPPPSAVNPNVPKELDEIVLKALSKDRKKRYENMDQLNRVLIKFLYANYPDFNASDLSYFAKELFKDEIKKDREKLFEFGKIDISPYISEWKAEQEGNGERVGGNGPTAEVGEVTGTERKTENVLDFGFDEEEKTKPSIRGAKTKKSQKITANPKGLDLDGEMVLEDGPRVNRPKQGEKRKDKKAVNDGTETRQIKLKKKKAAEAKKRKKLIFGLVGALAAVAFLGRDMIFPPDPEVTDRNPSSVEKEDKSLKLNEISKVEKGNSKIKLINFDRHKQKLYINGKYVKPDILNTIQVEMDQRFTMRVEQLSHTPHVQTYHSSKEDMMIEIPDLENSIFGYLVTTRNCVVGKIKFNLFGEERVEELPIRRAFGLPFPVHGDGREPAGEKQIKKFEAFVIKNGTDIERKIEFSFSRDDEKVDLCDLI